MQRSRHEHATDSLSSYDIGMVASETFEAIQEAARLWMDSADGKGLWTNSQFREGLLFALHIGETSEYCSTYLGTLMASDARRLDEVKTLLDCHLFDNDVLVRLSARIAANSVHCITRGHHQSGT